MKGFIGKRSLVTSLVAGASLLSIGSAAASADTVSDYAPNANSRAFTTSAGGWTNSKTSGGLCIPVLLCPTVTSTFQATGGADGADDGYITTRQGSLLGAASESSGVWTSPSFTYTGAGGTEADELKLTLSTRADVASLIAVTGNSVDYSVQILSGTSGSNVVSEPVDRDAVVDRSNWVGTSPVNLNAHSLSVGGTYRIRIITRFVGGALVLPSVRADYDNVQLRAVDSTPTGGGGGGNGSNGQNGQNGQNAGNGLSSTEVRNIVEKGIPGSATVIGNRVFVKLACAKRVTKKCRYAVVGLTRRAGARTTLPRFARIAHGKAKQLGLQVRPGAQARLSTSHKALFRIRVRALGRTTTFFKSLKLVHKR